MDVRILNKPSADSLVLSSSLQSLQVHSTFGPVRVSLKCGFDLFYQAVFHPYGCVVEISNFSEVIELYFRRNRWFRHVITLEAVATNDPQVGDSVEFECLFCAAVVHGFDPKDSFITAATARRVPPSAVVSLYSCALRDSDPYFLYLSGSDAAGRPTGAALPSMAVDGAVSVDIPALADHWRRLKGGSLRMVVARVNDKAVYFAIDKTPGWIEFRYRNRFNCPESIFVQGKVAVNPEVAKSTAICAGKITLYDVRPEFVYSIEAESLAAAECDAISMLMLSSDVALVVDGVDCPVAITEHSAKFSSDNSQIPSIKFSWMFTDRLPRFSTDAGGFGIFTLQFTDPFQ